jgi:AmmeMemoRadiSam system protein A
MLEDTERAELLNLADRSIARGRDRRQERPPERAWPPRLLELCATFTTLRLDGELRGCCGTIDPQRSLVDDVWHSAWSSAYADPRFWPVSPDELGSLEISISVLTELELLPAHSDAELIACLNPGTDGLVLRCGACCATFLPAVWKSLSDPRDFVEQLKRKAGWLQSGWPPGMTALRYGTETFSSPGRSMLAA